jgi:hypothetical protein
MTITIQQRAPHAGGVLAAATGGCSTTTSIIVERPCLAATVALPCRLQSARSLEKRFAPACVPFDDLSARSQSRTPLRRGYLVLA